MPDISLYNTFEIVTVPDLASSQKQQFRVITVVIKLSLLYKST